MTWRPEVEAEPLTSLERSMVAPAMAFYPWLVTCAGRWSGRAFGLDPVAGNRPPAAD